MSVSFLVTTHNETETLDTLLKDLVEYKLSDQEIIVLDDFSDNKDTLDIFAKYKKDISFYQHALNLDYGAHKNYGRSLCKKDWIFQIDGDEVVNKYLLTNLDAIIEKNEKSDVIWVPRINYFLGITDNYLRKWRWRVNFLPTLKDVAVMNTTSEEYEFLANRHVILKSESIDNFKSRVEYRIPLINYPDYQSRITKNISKIKYERKLHERIVGNDSETYIPPNQYVLSLLHKKTIQQQLETNERYNRLFTKDENIGYLIRGK